MKSKLQESLRKDFPLLYEGEVGKKGVIISFEFECGDGWYELLKELSKKLYPLIEESRKVPNEFGFYSKATQVKEKFGGLRFYMTTASDEMHDIIDEFEALSTKTCEICGDPGSIDSSRNVLQCLCPKHRPK